VPKTVTIWQEPKSRGQAHCFPVSRGPTTELAAIFRRENRETACLAPILVFWHMISGFMSMRLMVLAVFVLGVIGTGSELLFLGHIVGIDQLIPIVLLVMSLLVLAWHGLERKSASLKAFQITMILLVIAGILGTGFHFWANEKFELEGDPNMKGMALFAKVMTGAAPALAPGAIVQLGLLGLIFTFRHPTLGQQSKEE